LCKHSSDNYFVKLEQNIIEENKRVSVKINPDQLLEIINALTIYAEELNHLMVLDARDVIKKEEQQLIITTFLKGITIKDLSLQFRYKEAVIKDFLVKNDIVII
jgi:uncharacterized protein YehS (DUF1456 family)